MQKIKIFFLLVMGFSFLACVETEEILYLKKGGTVSWTLNIKLPDTSKTNADNNKSPITTNKAYQVDAAALKLLGITYHEDHRIMAGVEKFSISLDLPNPGLLKEVYDKIKPDESAAKPDDKKAMESFDAMFSGKNAFQFKQQGDIYIITRKILLPKPKEAVAKKKVKNSKDEFGFGKEFGDMFLNMMYVRFEIITDGEIISSNAHERVGNSLRWEASIGGLMRGALLMEAKIKL